ncbi:MAG: FtsW/RodA/SpoVE family cell cycle protein [Brochothrix sp.]|uniref:FtsW/RodA/SpoVE family cell cycle protein n=1 Tax=Brochothrix sp. TaxID=1993875 RepID=UPI00257FE2DD|nr:FtsW/RodA/SpoVE family cell cycle protein [Brochothrix sp.]MBR5526647.1 FtsW/RodA/SpoVE family cell cycle protein [Brochothrix sp.]
MPDSTRKGILKNIRFFDYGILITTLALVIFGCIMVYSSSLTIAIAKEVPPYYFFSKQIKFAVIGIFVFFFFANFNYRFFYREKVQYWMVIISLASLVAVLLFAKEINGSKSWLFGIQPAEFCKIALILYLARCYSSKKTDTPLTTNQLFKPLVIFGFYIITIIAEPDVGMSLMYAGITLFLIAGSGLEFKKLAKLYAGFILIVGFVYILVINIPQMFISVLGQNRANRLISFADPFQYEGTTGHQVINSYYAIGSGGFFGQGLGNSVQKLGYLPEAHTDFIIAVVAEELGFMGVAFVILGIGYLIYRCIRVGLESTDSFATLICYGVGSWLFVQTAINLGGATGLMPLTGVALPFISAGGSSLIALLIPLGIVTNISMKNKRRRLEQTTKS